MELFTKIVRACEQSGDKIAIKFHGREGAEVSYCELLEQVNNISLKLKSCGGTDQMLALALSRTPAYIAYMLAALNINNPFLSIDIKSPTKRIKKILIQAGASFIIFDQNSQIADELNLCLDNEKCVIGGISICRLDAVECNSNDLAYVMFTSGSSGEPKGVMITRKNLNLFSDSITSSLSLNNYNSILASTSFCFDISILETLVALANGMTIHLTSDEYTSNPHKVKELIEREKIDIVQMTPSHIRLLYKYSRGKLSFLRNIKLLLLGGESFPEEIRNDICTSIAGCVYNMYGPTETTIWAASKIIGYDSPITIGRPIRDYYITLHDQDGNAVPKGTRGEIWIGGDAVGNGYSNRCELTEKVFTTYEGRKIYKTGDIGVELENGDFQWIGRLDNQIKIKGNRVELEEIEHTIRGVDGVENAVVLHTGGFDLICYYVSHDEINEKHIRDYLLNNLPEYMIPTRFIKEENLPIDVNGKVNRTGILGKSVQSN